MGTGARQSGHLVLLTQAHQQGGGSEVQQRNLKLVALWDASIAGSGLTGWLLQNTGPYVIKFFFKILY